jgi:hypothetical protein
MKAFILNFQYSGSTAYAVRTSAQKVISPARFNQ